MLDDHATAVAEPEAAPKPGSAEIVLSEAAFERVIAAIEAHGANSPEALGVLRAAIAEAQARGGA